MADTIRRQKHSPDTDDMDTALQQLADDELDRAISETSAELRSADTKKAPQTPPAHSGHRARMRERFFSTGFEGFAPHEVIELLLFYAIPQRDTKALAHQLISRFGSVSGILNAERSELLQIKGISDNTAALLSMFPQLHKYCSSEQLRQRSFTDSEMLCELFTEKYRTINSETFLLACFDSSLKLLSIVPISDGSSSSTRINMRTVASEIIHTGCTMAAMAHNHPCDSSRPSDEDVFATRRIIELLRQLDVRLMDHIVISDGGAYSMRDGGELGIFD